MHAERSTTDLFIDATICPVIVEENREKFEVNQIGENLFQVLRFKRTNVRIFPNKRIFFGEKQLDIINYPQFNGLRIFDIRIVKAIQCPGR